MNLQWLWYSTCNSVCKAGSFTLHINGKCSTAVKSFISLFTHFFVLQVNLFYSEPTDTLHNIFNMTTVFKVTTIVCHFLGGLYNVFAMAMIIWAVNCTSSATACDSLCRWCRYLRHETVHYLNVALIGQN